MINVTQIFNLKLI